MRPRMTSVEPGYRTVGVRDVIPPWRPLGSLASDNIPSMTSPTPTSRVIVGGGVIGCMTTI